MQFNNESNSNNNHFKEAVGDCVEALGQVEEALDETDKIGLQTSSIEISEEDVQDNTVDEIKTLIQNQDLPKSELKKALEIEEKGKNRKTAKKAIKRDLKRKKSSNLRKKIRNDAQELRKLLANLETYDEYKQNADSETESEPNRDRERAEMTVKTERVLKKLKEGNLSAEELEKVKQAIEDYEQEDFVSMNQKLEEIDLSKESTVEDLDTKKEISKMENMLRNLEKKEEQIQNDQPEEIDNMRSKIDEIERDQRMKSRIRRLGKEGFDPKNLERLSNSELKDLESSEGSVDEIEDIFTKIDDSKSRFESKPQNDGDVDENIQKLEKMVD
ncbi:hypothetical protein GLU64_00330 [Nanohaloarchaea archaeon]|nr:hypothetical protein [Candidatus Nanohaloarchaea archaeon]